MSNERTVFSQILDFIPRHQFRTCAGRYNGNYRIKSFFGTSINAVKTQIWIAISVYVLVAIIRKELKLERSLHEILQILSILLFEKTSLKQALTGNYYTIKEQLNYKQLSLFDL